MKNIHVLPTDKPSRLIIYSTLLNEFRLLDKPIEDWKHKKNIFITNDEEIKEGDWVIVTNIANGLIFVKQHKGIAKALSSPRKKIILTTDQDLIKDGVQPIPDEFLEWFVKNPSCERVEVIECYTRMAEAFYGYEIIIPKEEPKQETLEEYIQSLFTNEDEDNKILFSSLIRSGAKWQQERSYSEEDMLKSFHCGKLYQGREGHIYFEQLINKLKNK
jgi:hypothetical protein